MAYLKATTLVSMISDGRLGKLGGSKVAFSKERSNTVLMAFYISFAIRFSTVALLHSIEAALTLVLIFNIPRKLKRKK
jgi:hypothetical protein